MTRKDRIAIGVCSLLIFGAVFSCTQAPPAPPASRPITSRPAKPALAPARGERLFKVKLRPVPEIDLAGYVPASQPSAEHIRSLIAQLAEIASPDFGLSATMGGTRFAPMPWCSQADAFVLTDHGIKVQPALRELVALGPTALPSLLEALDDSTPTHLSVTHEGYGPFGGMCLARELFGNPANKIEEKVIGPESWRGWSSSSFGAAPLTKYQVKVGDVCFVAIGQIVGRPYQAVRYQPTAIIVVNSPTADHALAEDVRAIWGSDSPARHLLDSLLLDYSSEGEFNGRSFDGWGEGSYLQADAAMRLLYYFPNQTADLIAQRLDGLDVRAPSATASYPTTADVDPWMKREVANAVRTDEFIRAVAWCRLPAIQEALRRIRERTNDHDILEAVRRPYPDNP